MNAANPPDVSMFARCAVCDGPVPLANALLQKGKPLLACRDFDCQRLVGLQATMPPALFKAQFEFQRQRIREFRERQAQRKRHIDTVEREEEQENQQLLHQFLAENPAHAETPPALLTLPQGRETIAPLADERVQAYRLHVQSIIQEAINCTGVNDLSADEHSDAHDKRLLVENLFAAHPDLQTVSDQLCTRCKGGCCASGANEAYLSAVTIRRLLDAEPDLTADDILQRYLQLLPAESVANSCINQTASGCALPRDWRSDVCNSYYCNSLRPLHREWEAGEAPDAVLVVQRAHTNWNRFDGEGPNAVVGVTLVNLLP